LAGSVPVLALPEMLSRLVRLRLTAELLDDDLELAAGLCSANSLVDVAQAVRVAVTRRLGCAGATFVLVDGDQCFHPEADPIAPVWAGQRFSIGECVCGWSIQHDEAATINDLDVDERVPPQALRPSYVRSLVAVPIVGSAGPAGALGGYWLATGQAGRADLGWLRRLAEATGAAIAEIGLQGAPWAPNFRSWLTAREDQACAAVVSGADTTDRRILALLRTAELARRCAGTATDIAIAAERRAKAHRATAQWSSKSERWTAAAQRAELLAHDLHVKSDRYWAVAEKVAKAV
jgi:GAF domain-containing protein